MEDYYKILGVNRNASKSEIKQAFRKLAHKYHPDKGGDETQFKKITEAYSVLSDDKKRQQYDMFGSASNMGGDPFASGFGFQSANFSGNFQDIFDMFTGRSRRPRGKDVLINLKISFQESILGTSREVKIPYRNKNQEKVDIKIPRWISDGQRLRMPGFGEDIENGDPGDLIIEIIVERDSNFRKVGNSLIYKLEIPLTDMLLGKKIQITSIEGRRIKVDIPKCSKDGDLLRVSLKGLVEFFIKIRVSPVKKLSRKAIRLLEELKREGL